MTQGSLLVDDLVSNQPQNAAPLKILIVGAGIAGLTAAIALRQNGHEVHLYEQSQLADEIGAAIHISPNANSVLRRLGIDVAERGAPKLIQTRYYNSQRQLLSCEHNEANSHRWQAPWLQAHRGHLHAQLKERATSAEYEGIAAKIHTSSRIEALDSLGPSITLSNGESVHGDVLVGADGVRSVTRRAVAESRYDSFEIGMHAFRFMVPRADVLADPETASLGETMGSLDLFFSETHKVIMYPCVNNTLLNIVCIHPADQSNASAETYNKSVSKEELLQLFHGWDPRLLKLFGKCDSDTLKVYPLFDAVSMPTFVKDRLALIGDAAHPFTPFIGQGGAIALEDSVSLGVMLGRGITKTEVPARLQLYNKARHERATLIQGFSRTAGGDGVKPGEEKAARMKGREHALYAIGHDEFHASTQVLREDRWSKTSNMRWRQPTVFGPTPSSIRVALDRAQAQLKTVTAKIDFKTSGTLLRNMFPNKRYSFSVRDTVVVASFIVEKFDNVEWLGFKSFNRVRLDIPGISYTKLDGSVLTGRYMPIMFEDSADTITAGRENYGFPILYSDIRVDDSNESSFHATLSWRDVEWAKVSLKNLVPDFSLRPSTITEGVFVNRYMAVINDAESPGKRPTGEDFLITESLADTCAIFTNGNGVISDGSEISAGKGSQILKSTSNATIEIVSRDKKELPTLHQAVSRLEELPIFEIVSATLRVDTGAEKILKTLRVG